MKRTTSVIAAYLYPARTGMADRLVVLVHDWFVVLHPAIGDTQRPLEQIAALLRRQRAVGLD